MGGPRVQHVTGVHRTSPCRREGRRQAADPHPRTRAPLPACLPAHGPPPTALVEALLPCAPPQTPPAPLPRIQLGSGPPHHHVHYIMAPAASLDQLALNLPFPHPTFGRPSPHPHPTPANAPEPTLAFTLLVQPKSPLGARPALLPAAHPPTLPSRTLCMTSTPNSKPPAKPPQPCGLLAMASARPPASPPAWSNRTLWEREPQNPVPNIPANPHPQNPATFLRPIPSAQPPPARTDRTLRRT